MQSNYHPDATLDNVVNRHFRGARAAVQATSVFKNLSVYVYFAHSDEGPGVWYTPAKLDDVTSLKRKWDPTRRLSFY